jgi:hypothetical protein
MKKTIKIYSVIDRDDSGQKPSYYKGTEELRDFAKDRLYSGWETNVKEDDLDDDVIMFDFLQNDYGVDIEVIKEVTIDDLQ